MRVLTTRVPYHVLQMLLVTLAITIGPGAACNLFTSALTDLDSTDQTNTPADSDADPTSSTSGQTGGIIADHQAAAAFDAIPDSFIHQAKSSYRIFYGHTSHGSQIITGMQLIQAQDSLYAFNAGTGSLRIDEDEWADLGQDGDLDWADTTRNVLAQPDSNINLVMWSWCGGVSDNTQAGINTYLNAMNQLESDYPDVVFIYMTGHLDGTGPNENLYARNNQIRNYCRSNDKVLFDFADIESYDPDGSYYPWGSDWCEWCETWCESHTCPACDDCAHSQCMNCYQKGKAFWWMMARLAGWSGS
jgi:hypothetical protein